MGNSWSSYEDFSEVNDEVIKPEDKKKKSKKSKTAKKIPIDKNRGVSKIEYVENKIHTPEIPTEYTIPSTNPVFKSTTADDACSIPVQELSSTKPIGKRRKTVKFREPI
jgi:hypothetical protein